MTLTSNSSTRISSEILKLFVIAFLGTNLEKAKVFESEESQKAEKS